MIGPKVKPTMPRLLSRTCGMVSSQAGQRVIRMPRRRRAHRHRQWPYGRAEKASVSDKVGAADDLVIRRTGGSPAQVPMRFSMADPSADRRRAEPAPNKDGGLLQNYEKIMLDAGHHRPALVGSTRQASTRATRSAALSTAARTSSWVMAKTIGEVAQAVARHNAVGAAPPHHSHRRPTRAPLDVVAEAANRRDASAAPRSRAGRGGSTPSQCRSIRVQSPVFVASIHRAPVHGCLPLRLFDRIRFSRI